MGRKHQTIRTTSLDLMDTIELDGEEWFVTDCRQDRYGVYSIFTIVNEDDTLKKTIYAQSTPTVTRIGSWGS